MATNYSFLVLFFFIFSLTTQARVMREMNNFNMATADDKPFSVEDDDAAFFPTKNSNGDGLFGIDAKDPEFNDFASATTNQALNDKDIPAKYSNDVGYNQGGSYANKDAANTNDEDELYKPEADTKKDTTDEDELYKSRVARYFAGISQQDGSEKYDDVMKRFDEMQQERAEDAKFKEGHEP